MKKQEIKFLPEPEPASTNHFRVCLGHVVRVISGQHLKPSEYNESKEGIPYITGPAEFGPRFPQPTKWTSEKRAVAKNGDILLTVKGSGIGKISVCNVEELAISRQLVAIRPLDGLNHDYLWLCLQAAQQKFQKLKMGIAIPGIGRQDVLNLRINLSGSQEQERIVKTAWALLNICDELARHHRNSSDLAKELAQSAIASITGIQIKEKEKMKAPKMELVSTLKVGSSPEPKDQAPLTSLLTKNKGELSAKTLWTHSGLEIAEFYQQLKTEMANGWIVEPEKAVMREVTAN